MLCPLYSSMHTDTTTTTTTIPSLLQAVPHSTKEHTGMQRNISEAPDRSCRAAITEPNKEVFRHVALVTDRVKLLQYFCFLDLGSKWLQIIT